MYFPNADRRVRLGRPMRYPWDQWTDGTERLLCEGEDFTCMAESFVILARRTGKVRGLHVVASAIKVPENKPDRKLVVKINDAPVDLEPGKTYVLLQFSGERAA